MVVRSRPSPSPRPEARGVPVDDRFIRRFIYLAAEPYPFGKVPMEPYHLFHGGHIDWLLAATGLGRMPTVEGVVLGEHTADTWGREPPRRLTLPGTDAGGLKAWLEESWESHRHVGYLSFEVRDPGSGLELIREVFCLWVVYRGRAPWTEAFLREFEPTGVWKVEPPHLWYAKLASAQNHPALRGYPDLAVNHVWEVCERVETDPEALYVAFWRLKEPWVINKPENKAVELGRLLRDLARAAKSERDPALAGPGFLMPLFCGSLLVVDGWHFPVDRRRYGFSNLPVGRAYSLVQVRAALKKALGARGEPEPRRSGRAVPQPSPRPVEPSPRIAPRVAVGLGRLADLGFGRTELETVAAALGVGFRDRKVFVERLLNRYRQAEGSVRLFLSARCAVGEDLQVEAAGLYEAYAEWCRQAGLDPLTRQKFGREMKGLGIPASRRGRPGRLFYRGVGLAP
jgi:hypothetical protein